MGQVSFALAGDPLGKERPRFGRGGRAFTPVATRDYEARVRASALEAIRDQGWECLPGAYVLRVASCSLPRRLRRSDRPDLDNVVKAAGDAINGVVYPDDAMVDVIEARRLPDDADNPHVVVHVERICLTFTGEAGYHGTFMHGRRCAFCQELLP